MRLAGNVAAGSGSTGLSTAIGNPRLQPWEEVETKQAIPVQAPGGSNDWVELGRAPYANGHLLEVPYPGGGVHSAHSKALHTRV